MSQIAKEEFRRNKSYFIDESRLMDLRISFIHFKKGLTLSSFKELVELILPMYEEIKAKSGWNPQDDNDIELLYHRYNLTHERFNLMPYQTIPPCFPDERECKDFFNDMAYLKKLNSKFQGRIYEDMKKYWNFHHKENEKEIESIILTIESFIYCTPRQTAARYEGEAA